MDTIFFIKGATNLAQCPPMLLPEIAFLGRSNVGKSSLLNALWQRRKLAFVSKKPGKTTEINFFSFQNKCLYVDMPGYGYARVTKKLKTLWEKNLASYIEQRETLIHVFVLVDSRHGIKKTDEETMRWLQHWERSFSIIFTKSDKINTPQRQTCFDKLQVLLHTPQLNQDYFFASVKKKETLQPLQTKISRILTEKN